MWVPIGGASDPNDLTFTQTHRVCIVVEPIGDGEGTTLQNIGAKTTLSSFDNDCSQIYWIMRWSPKGLMPVKPVVYMKAGIALQPGTSCKCFPKPTAGI